MGVVFALIAAFCVMLAFEKDARAQDFTVSSVEPAYIDGEMVDTSTPEVGSSALPVLVVPKESVDADDAVLPDQEMAMADEPLAEIPAKSVADVQPDPIHQGMAKVGAILFTTDVAEQKPVDSLVGVSSGYGDVYAFSEVLNMSGQRVTQRWERDGAVLLEHQFDVQGNRWAVWSRYPVSQDADGPITVSVIDEFGDVLASKQLSVDL